MMPIFSVKFIICFFHTNVLIRKFSKCSLAVKIILFKTYCICLYDASLWRHYYVRTLGRMRSCYNRCIKLFFGYKKQDSLSKILVNLGIPSFDTILINAATSLRQLNFNCANLVVQHFSLLHYF